MNRRLIAPVERDAETLRLEQLLGRTRVPMDLPQITNETQESILKELQTTTSMDDFTRCTQLLIALLVQE